MYSIGKSGREELRFETSVATESRRAGHAIRTTGSSGSVRFQTMTPNPRRFVDKTPRTRRVTVQLSETIFEQLESATDRAGAGKSMVVEAAVERFLSPTPPIEKLMQQYFDQIRARLNCFERADHS